MCGRYVNKNTIDDLTDFFGPEFSFDISSPNGNPVSYNFTPGSKIYSDSNQNSLDVYCYPRKNDWILGGSRFTGTLDKYGNWVSDDPLSTTFPHQIEKLNAEILAHTFGIDINKFEKKEYLHSYRYVRNKTNGLRLEQDQNKDQNKELQLSAFDGSYINPIIKINNTHQHVNIMSNLNITSNLNVSNNLNVTGATILSDTLNVSDATTLSDILNVTGATTLGGSLFVNNEFSYDISNNYHNNRNIFTSFLNIFYK